MRWRGGGLPEWLSLAGDSVQAGSLRTSAPRAPAGGRRRRWSARDRIDKAFDKSTLPAELVVWRSDEPGSPLADAVERLAGRIAPAREA